MDTSLTTVSTIAQIIQIAVAPVFLLAGISGLITVMTNRLARVIDRTRILQRGRKQVDEKEESLLLVDRELEQLRRRGNFINLAINFSTFSALLVCLVIMALFLGGLLGSNFSYAVAVLFIICMAMLIASLAFFLVEVFIATRSMRKGLIRAESLIT